MKKFAFLFIIFSFLLAGCKKRYQTVYTDLFDTVSSVTIYTDKDPEEIFSSVHSLLLKYHSFSDIYNEYPGINNAFTINLNAGKKYVQVDPELIDLLTFGKEMYYETDGALNISSGALLKLWHEARENGLPPSSEDLKEASLHMDIDRLLINEKEGTVFLSDPQMKLDLGGIAKGYAAERVSEMLSSLGVTSCIISLGGNVRCLGKKEDSVFPSYWKVAAESPFYRDSGQGEMSLCELSLEDSSLVTSGDYERYFEYNGKRYCHIIDTGTLFPGSLHRSVTVLCRDSGLADALSTAFFLKSSEECFSLAEKLSKNDPIGLLIAEPDGEIKMNEEMKRHIIN